MSFYIRLNSTAPHQVTIEAFKEDGDILLALLLKENYTLIEYIPEAIGRSENDAFDHNNPTMKYYSLITLAQRDEFDIKKLVSVIHSEFGGYCTNQGDIYLISSEESDYAI